MTNGIGNMGGGGGRCVSYLPWKYTNVVLLLRLLICRFMPSSDSVSVPPVSITLGTNGTINCFLSHAPPHAPSLHTPTALPRSSRQHQYGG